MKNIKNIFVLSLLSFFLLSNSSFSQAKKTYPVNEEGTLAVTVEDDFKTGKSREKYYLQQQGKDGAELSISNSKYQAGSIVKVRGEKKDNGIQVEEISAISQNVVYNNPVSGAHRIAVILANFKNRSGGNPSNNSAKSLFDQELSPFLAEMSFSKATFTADVYGWVKMNIPGTCEIAKYAPAAIKAADSQINYNNYKYVMIVFPNQNCSYGGIAYYPPGVTYTTAEGQKSLQVSALPSEYVTNWLKTVGAHELGHSLGLRHANGFECGAVSLSTTCTSTEYGDQFDIMGGTYQYSGHYGSYYKEFLNWIPATGVRVVTQSGRYTVNPVELSTTGIQSLKVFRPGSSAYFSIENRVATSLSILPTNATSGAVIKVVPNTIVGVTTPTSSNIIDRTPQSQTSNDFVDAGWPIGSVLNDTVSRVAITPVSKVNNVLTVDVLYY